MAAPPTPDADPTDEATAPTAPALAPGTVVVLEDESTESETHYGLVTAADPLELIKLGAAQQYQLRVTQA